MVQKLLKISLLAFFSLFLTSEDLLVTSMTEKEYINFKANLIKSIENHPEALLQDSLVSQKVYDVEIVKSRLKPQLHFLSSSKSPALDSETDSFFQSIQQKQHSTIDQTLVFQGMLTDFGQTKNLVLQEKHNVSSTSAISLSEKSKLVLRALDACMDSAVYFLLYEATKASFLRHEEISNLIKIRVEAGRAPGRELSRSNARLSEAKAKKILMSSKLSESQARFKSFLPAQEVCRKLPLTNFFIEMDAEKALFQAKNKNDEMRAYSFKIESLQNQVTSIKKSKLPTISAQLRADKYDISNTEDYELFGGVNLNWDLYQGNRRRTQENKAKEEVRAASYEQSAFGRELESIVSSNLAELKNGQAKLEAFKEAYYANLESRSQLKAQFFSANVSLLDLLQSERDFLESIESLIFNSKEVIMTKYVHLHYLGELVTEFNLDSELSSDSNYLDQ